MLSEVGSLRRPVLSLHCALFENEKGLLISSCRSLDWTEEERKGILAFADSQRSMRVEEAREMLICVLKYLPVFEVCRAEEEQLV